MAEQKKSSKKNTGTRTAAQAKKSTPAKKSTTAKKAAPVKKTQPVREVKKPVNREIRPQERPRKNDGIISLEAEIVIWLMLAFSLLICLSNFFGLGGGFGRAVSGFFFGIFGILGYLIPFILFFGTAFIAVNKRSRSLTTKILSFCLLMITLCCLLELILGDFDAEQEILSYYETGASLHTGGGLIGGILCSLLCPILGSIGAGLFDFILMIISIITLTGKSAIDNIYKGSQSMVDSYQERGSRRAAAASDKEEAMPRRERVRTGVSLDTRITADKDTEVSKDIHEVIPPVKSRAKKLVESLDAQEKPGLQMEFPIQGNVDAQDKPEADAPVDEEPVIVKELKYKNPRSSKEEQEKDKQAVEEEIRNQELLPKKVYKYPPVKLLGRGNGKGNRNSTSDVRETAAKLQSTLESFGVDVTITNVSCGPSVTRYELKPEQGVKVSKIVNLSDDIKLNLAAADIRIEAPIPGKDAIGIEVPNKENSAVFLRELLETDKFAQSESNLTFAVGKDIAGQPVITDIAKMPHLLIAGATGSGKSVCINTLIMSILYKANPSDVKLIMIDPKVVELSVYNGIPHLMIPVVTDPKKASGALNWAVAEMTSRYEKFSQVGVRDLKGYNKRVEAIPDGTEGKPEKLPQIVIIVDELADLMMVAPGEVEDAICRLAQLARAAGLHLIIATQRPSVNVITGLIKANMPSRIAFSVTSGVDSRTILDMNGAEKLLGKGDMLFYPQGYPKPIRVQGAFVTDEEVGRVTDFLKDNLDEELYGTQQTIDIDKYSSAGGTTGAAAVDSGSDRDSYFAEAGKFIIEKDKASIGMLQRVFKIGFNRAARIMDQLAEAGVVGPEEGTKPRKILMSMEEFEQYVDEYV